jgi:hypothetical protein
MKQGRCLSICELLLTVNVQSFQSVENATLKSRYLMQLFKEHNAKVKALIGNGFEANTLKGYNTSGGVNTTNSF